MKKLLVIILALALAASSGFFVSTVLAPFTQPVIEPSAPLPTTKNNNEITSDVLIDVLNTVSTTSSSTSAVTRIGIYARYAEGSVGHGANTLLFFHDPAAEASIALDASLRSLYASGTATIDTFRIDGTPESSLFLTYGISRAPALVVLGPNGERLQSIDEPDVSALPALVGTR